MFQGKYYFSFNQTLIATDGTSDGTRALSTLADGDHLNLGFNTPLAVAAGQLFMPGHRGVTGYGDTALFTLSSPQAGIRQLGSEIDAELSIDALTNEGDGLISEDLIDTVWGTKLVHLSQISGQVHADVSELLREALRRGHSRITLQLSVASTATYIRVENTSPDTQLRLNVPEPVKPLIDIFDADGRVLAAGRSVVDMRAFDAGDYYVTVHANAPDRTVTSPLPFQIEINAPLAGQTRAIYGDKDRDRIEGGDGDDIISGNADLDRLSGGNGRDQFIADTIHSSSNPSIVARSAEIRDFQEGIDYSVIASSIDQSLSQNQFPELDPAIPVGVVSNTLAEQLDIAVTGNGKLAREIRASDLASLSTLDLAHFETSLANANLDFLKYATNLKSLNLSRNADISSLESLRPRIDFDTGAQLGTSQLEHLAIDDTGVSSLAPIVTLSQLRSLSADRLSDGLAAFNLSNMHELNLLSIDGISSSLSPRPAALWHGDGNFIDSVSNDVATPIGGAVANSPGQSGTAFHFDGINDRIDLGNNANLNLTGSMTLSLWVRFDRLNAGQYMFADFDASGRFSQGALGQSAGLLDWHQTTDAGLSYDSLFNGRLRGQTPLQTNRWYNVMVVRDDAAKTVTMYLDGKFEATQFYFGNVVSVQSPRMLGMAPGFTNTVFGGSLDEVALFYEALTPSQVKLFQTPPQRLNDTSLATLQDLTNLQVVSLQNQSISSVKPLTSLDALTVLNLDGNLVRDLAPLIDDHIQTYPLSFSGWSTNVHPVASTVDGNYFWHDGQANTATPVSPATWAFNDLEAGSYEVLTTWQAGDDRATNATYTYSQLNDTSGSGIPLALNSVNQRFKPQSPSGVPGWQSLGVIQVSDDTVSTFVHLSAVGDGIVIGEAIRLRRIASTVTGLHELSLLGNPLSNDARDRVLPQLSSVIENLSTPASELRYDVDNYAPVIQPIPNVVFKKSTPIITVPLNTSDADGDAVSYSFSGLPNNAFSVDGNSLSLNSTGLAPGNYRVTVTATDKRNNVVLGRTGQQTLDVTIPPVGNTLGAAIVSGRKLDILGNPAEGWTIFLDMAPGVTLSTVTDLNGDFAFSTAFDFTTLTTWTLREEIRAGWHHASDYTFSPLDSDVENYVIKHDLVSNNFLRIVALRDAFPNPQVVAGPVPEGQPITFLANALVGQQPVTFLWKVNGVAQSTNGSFEFVPPNEGRYTVELTLTRQPLGEVDTIHYDLFVNNAAPADVTGNVVGSLVEGGSLSLSASATDTDALLFQWDIDGDGSYDDATGAQPRLTWQQLAAILPASRLNGPSTGSIRVRAFDGTSYAESDPITLSIDNAAPVANTGGPFTINEGTDLLLTANGTFDYGDPTSSLLYAWDVDYDGVNDYITDLPQLLVSWNDLVGFSIDDSGYSNFVRLQVIDPQGAVATSTTMLTVVNRPAEITTTAPTETLHEGDTLSMLASWTDLPIDTHTLLWTVSKQGVTLATSTQSQLNYVLTGNGEFEVTLTVTDNEDAVATKTFAINSGNLAPRASLQAPSISSEGQLVVVQLNDVTDSPDDMAAGLRFDFDFDGDGQWDIVNSTISSAGHVYNEDGLYRLITRVRDQAGGSSVLQQSIVVNNVAPVATFAFVTTGVVRESDTSVSVQFSSASDPSPLDTAAGFRYSFDLDNDGVFEIENSLTTTQTVSLTQRGDRTVRGRVTDRDGSTREYSTTLNVANIAPTIVDLQIPASILEGQEVEFTGHVSDPGINPLQTFVKIRPASDLIGSGVQVPVSTIGGEYRFTYRFPNNLATGYMVDVTVSDGLDSAVRSFQVDVANQSPVLVAVSESSTRVAQIWTRTIEFVDPGSDDWLVTVNYGDGTPDEVRAVGSERALKLTHIFGSAGDRTLTVSIDDGTSVTSGSSVVHVASNLAPVVARPMGSLNVQQATRLRSAVADLGFVFADTDALAGEVTYRIASSSTPALAALSIENGELLVALDPARFGTSVITVEARDAAGSVATDQLTLNVTGFDVTAPTSAVAAFPAIITSLDLPIAIVGSDVVVAGQATSGVSSYDLYVSIDGAASTKFATVPASAPSTTYHALSNHHYFFYSLGRDLAGNVQTEATASVRHVFVGDLSVPVSRVDSAVANSSGVFSIAVSGTDGGSSGLQRFDVYVSTDDGIAALIASAVAGSPDASGVYRATLSYQARLDSALHNYRFFSIARDGAGNIEAAPARDSDVLVSATFNSQSLRTTGIDVQQGEQQRSYIRTVDVLFNSDAGLASLLAQNPVSIYRYSLNATDITREAGTQVTGGVASVVGDRIRIDFGSVGITGNRSTNAGDGLYRVFVDGDADGLYNSAVDAVFEFARILGDADGNSVVDAADTSLVNAQQGRIGAGFSGDVDGSGAVNVTDKQKVAAQQGRSLAANLRSLLDD